MRQRVRRADDATRIGYYILKTYAGGGTILPAGEQRGAEDVIRDRALGGILGPRAAALNEQLGGRSGDQRVDAPAEI